MEDTNDTQPCYDNLEKVEALSQTPTQSETDNQFEAEYEAMYEGSSPERNFINCTKHFRHENFKTIKNIKKEDLPKGYQDEETLKKIKNYCDRTVRIKVSALSEDRPDIMKCRPCPKRYGTGFLFPGEWLKDGLCRCVDCKSSGDPKKGYHTAYVLTASHVVYDDTEAWSSEFDLFYDSEVTVGVKHIYGLGIVADDDYGDEKGHKSEGEDRGEGEGSGEIVNRGEDDIGGRENVSSDDGEHCSGENGCREDFAVKDCLAKEDSKDENNCIGKRDSDGETGLHGEGGDEGKTSVSGEGGVYDETYRKVAEEYERSPDYILYRIGNHLIANAEESLYKTESSRFLRFEIQFKEDSCKTGKTGKDAEVNFLSYMEKNDDVDNDAGRDDIGDDDDVAITIALNDPKVKRKMQWAIFRKLTRKQFDVQNGDVDDCKLDNSTIGDLSDFGATLRNEERLYLLILHVSFFAFPEMYEKLKYVRDTLRVSTDSCQFVERLIKTRLLEDIHCEKLRTWTSKVTELYLDFHYSFRFLEELFNGDIDLAGSHILKLPCKSQKTKVVDVDIVDDYDDDDDYDKDENGDVNNEYDKNEDEVYYVVDDEVVEWGEDHNHHEVERKEEHAEEAEEKARGEKEREQPDGYEQKDEEEEELCPFDDWQNPTITFTKIDHHCDAIDTFRDEVRKMMDLQFLLLINVSSSDARRDNLQQYATAYMNHLSDLFIRIENVDNDIYDNIISSIHVLPEDESEWKRLSNNLIIIPDVISSLNLNMSHQCIDSPGDEELRTYMADRTLIKCASHDPELITFFSSMKFFPPRLPFSFMISHPHGYLKRIGYGNVTGSLERGQQTYFLLTLEQSAVCRLSADAKEPNPDLVKFMSKLKNGCVAIQYGVEYCLGKELRLACTWDVMKECCDTMDRKDDAAWYSFPVGTVYVHDDAKSQSANLPEELEFQFSKYDLFNTIVVETAKGYSHDVPTCPGSSGGLVHFESDSRFNTHSGSYRGSKHIGYTSIVSDHSGRKIDSSVKAFLDIRYVLFAGGSGFRYHRTV